MRGGCRLATRVATASVAHIRLYTRRVHSRRFALVVALGVVTGCGNDDPALTQRRSAAPPATPDRGAVSRGLPGEAEPNDAPANATPIVGRETRVRGNLYPAGDVDSYSFPCTAGDQVFTFIQATASPGTADTVLAVYDGAGTLIETDDDSGSLPDLASSIAGARMVVGGTCRLQLSAKVGVTVRPYDLYLAVRSGVAADEVVANDYPGTPLPPEHWVYGGFGPGDDDYYLFDVDDGSTVFVSLDLDPGRLGTEPPDVTSTGFYVIDGVGIVVNGPNGPSPNSEAVAATVGDAEAATAFASLGNGHDYFLSVGVAPGPDTSGCTTVTSTDVPQFIPSPAGVMQSTLEISDDVLIDDLDFTMVGENTYAFGQFEIRLISPLGTSVNLAIGPGGSTGVRGLRLDDEAATVLRVGSQAGPSTTVVVGPEPGSRLSWFDGQPAQGTWTLVVEDAYGETGFGSGTLYSWGLTVCARPAAPACPTGSSPVSRTIADFDADDGGFTHGVGDDWAHGTPASANLAGCKRGACWKTNLTGTYAPSRTSELVSPAIDLGDLIAPITLEWWQAHQLEDADADRAFVDVEELGDGGVRVRAFEHLDPTMVGVFGTVGVIPVVAGWAQHEARLDALAGKTVRLRAHLKSDADGEYEGLAIDEIRVHGCVPDPVSDAGVPDAAAPDAAIVVPDAAAGTTDAAVSVSDAAVGTPDAGGADAGSVPRPDAGSSGGSDGSGDGCGCRVGGATGGNGSGAALGAVVLALAFVASSLRRRRARSR